MVKKKKEDEEKKGVVILLPGRWHPAHFNNLGVSHDYYLHRKS